jgi:aryl-alcohol dehydrogenase-like predicted oxidoreductase
MSTTTTETRSLGAGGRQLSAVGVGTWALGGPFTFNGRDAGWGEVDDAESIRALHVAIDAGVTLIDTAPTYGTGHSELIVGQALAELPLTVRESLAVATKFCLRIDEGRRTGGGTMSARRSFGPNANPACAGSSGRRGSVSAARRC